MLLCSLLILLYDLLDQGASNGKESVLALAAAAEAASEHPVGRAITEAARARGMAKRMPVVDGFQATPGMGISCTLVKTEKGGEGRPRGGEFDLIANCGRPAYCCRLLGCVLDGSPYDCHIETPPGPRCRFHG